MIQYNPVYLYEQNFESMAAKCIIYTKKKNGILINIYQQQIIIIPTTLVINLMPIRFQRNRFSKKATVYLAQNDV